MLSLFNRSIPSNILPVVAAQLDAFCKRTEIKARRKNATIGRFFWFRRGNAIIIAEEERQADGALVRRDSGKFVYDGAWQLYCLSVRGEWQRYASAPETESFAVAFQAWLSDATGIFGAPRIRRQTEKEIERDALAALVGASRAF